MRQACNGMAEDCRNILYDVFIDKTLALLDAEAEILKEMLRHGTVSAGFHAEAVTWKRKENFRHTDMERYGQRPD